MLLILAAGCGESTTPVSIDAMSIDAGIRDGRTDDATIRDAQVDAGPLDVGPGVDVGPQGDIGPRVDAGPLACDPLVPPAAPTTFAAITGRIDVFDAVAFDRATGGPKTTRRFAAGFSSRALVIGDARDAVLFRGIEEDSCIDVDISAQAVDPRPYSNVGTSIFARPDGVDGIELVRTDGIDGPQYFFSSAAALQRFDDPVLTPLSVPWIWSTPGDAVANIRGATAILDPLPPFTVTPALSAAATPVVIDAAGATFRWTTTSSSTDLSIVLTRTLNPRGDARHVICRPVDDGVFTVTSTVFNRFSAPAGIPFDVTIARSRAQPFCNEGAPSAVVTHAVAHVGSGVIP